MEIILSEGYDTPNLSNEERTNKELIERVKNDKQALFDEDDGLYSTSAYSFIVNVPDETTDFIVEYYTYPDEDYAAWFEEYVIYVVDGKIYKAEEDRK